MNPDDYEELADRLDGLWDQQGSLEFAEALGRLEAFADSGRPDAAEFLGEIRAVHGPHHDAEAAYRWYFIALSQRGYQTAFDDQNETPPFYRGPVGDFRNESMVSELIAELGFERVRLLDSEVRDWLCARDLAG